MPGPNRRGVNGWPVRSHTRRTADRTRAASDGTIPAMERVYTTPLLDKLGIRPGMRVALIDIEDDAIRPLLADRTSDLTEGWPEPDTDIVLLGAESTADLARLEELTTRIRPAGAIWVVSRKGKTATLRDVEVMAAGKSAGLVDNKVVSFSATHTALRLVIPVAPPAERRRTSRPSSAARSRRAYRPPLGSNTTRTSSTSRTAGGWSSSVSQVPTAARASARRRVATPVSRPRGSRRRRSWPASPPTTHRSWCWARRGHDRCRVAGRRVPGADPGADDGRPGGPPPRVAA